MGHFSVLNTQQKQLPSNFSCRAKRISKPQTPSQQQQSVASQPVETTPLPWTQPGYQGVVHSGADQMVIYTMNTAAAPTVATASASLPVAQMVPVAQQQVTSLNSDVTQNIGVQQAASLTYPTDVSFTVNIVPQ